MGKVSTVHGDVTPASIVADLHESLPRIKNLVTIATYEDGNGTVSWSHQYTSELGGALLMLLVSAVGEARADAGGIG